ncbi:hypothetical protein V8C44DRAFT_330333, partial [Trichoderma aethiopicum]
MTRRRISYVFRLARGGGYKAHLTLHRASCRGRCINSPSPSGARGGLPIFR